MFKNYIIYPTGVRIRLMDNRELFIHFTQDSGKIFYRDKINTISNVKHPGVYIGKDLFGNHYMVHNHIENGTARLDTLSGFSKGQRIFNDSRPCTNSQSKIISSALDQVSRKEPYHVISYNCQVMVNEACSNERKSEDVAKWFLIATGLTIGALLLR